MRRVSAGRWSEGMRLASPVKDEQGNLLLPKSATLQPQSIEGLLRRGIDSVFVDDPRFDGVEPLDTVSKPVWCTTRALFAEWGERLAGGEACPCVPYEPVRRLMVEMEGDALGRPSVPVVLLPVSEAEHRPAVQAINAARLALTLAPAVGLGRYTTDIAAGAFVRDVGLLALPVELRESVDPLVAPTDDRVLGHPQTGVACLMNPSLWHPLSKLVVGLHHERLDGSGYPRGLAGEQIHAAAALVGAIDAYTSLLDHVPGRAPCTPEQALEYVLSCAGAGLDAACARALCGSVGLYEPGTMVRLSTGEEAVVLEPGCGIHRRPQVRLLPLGEVVDLQEASALHILVEAVIDP